MDDFDYSAPAEIFASLGRGGRLGPVSYHRFTSSAEAIRFAIEQLSPQSLRASVLEVNDIRFEAAAIRALYDHVRYPLERKLDGGP
jgi:hypothetical protein